MDESHPKQTDPAPSGTSGGPCEGAEQGPEQGPGAFLRFCQNIQGFTQRDALLQAAVRLIPQLLAAEGGALLLKDEHTDEVFVPAVCMSDKDLAQRFSAMRFKLDMNCSGEAIKSEAPFIAGIWAHLPGGFQDLPDQVGERVYNRLTVPLQTRDAAIGALLAINKTRGDFSTDDARRLGAVAGVTASALEVIQARRQLAACNRNTADLKLAKDRAAHHLSHAIKTPLAVLIASLKLLEKYLAKSSLDGWQRIAERAQRNLERLLTIEYEVEDILRRRDDQNEEG